MSYTNYLNLDPVDAANQYLWDEEKSGTDLPVCDRCQETIYDYLYEVDLLTLCEDCARDWLEEQKHEM